MRIAIYPNQAGNRWRRFIVEALIATLRQSPGIAHSGSLEAKNIGTMVDSHLKPKEGYGCLVAAHENEFVACLLYRIDRDLFYDHLYIQYAYSVEKWRRKGIIGKLFQHVTKIAQDQKIFVLSARIQDWNKASLGIATRFGFKPLEFHMVKVIKLSDKYKISSLKFNCGIQNNSDIQLALSNCSERYALATGQRQTKKRLIQKAQLFMQNSSGYGVSGYVNRGQLQYVVFFRQMQHPFKNFLLVPFLFINEQKSTTIHRKKIFDYLEYRAKMWKLTEIATRVSLDDSELLSFLRAIGYSPTDTNFVRPLPRG